MGVRGEVYYFHTLQMLHIKFGNDWSISLQTTHEAKAAYAKTKQKVNWVI